MTASYKTESEAHAAIITKAIELTEKHCPLINAQCKGIYCMSWDKGSVWQLSEKSEKWYVRDARCQNSMVTGYLEVDMNCPNL